MHPLLGRLSFGQWTLPLAPLLAFVLLVAIAALAFGLWARRERLVVLGALTAASAAWFSSSLWGESYTAAPLLLPAKGVLLAVGAVGVWQWTTRAASAQGLSAATTRWALALGALGALVGGRLAYVLINELPLSALPALGEGGLSGVGALVGGLGLAAWGCRREPQTALALFDAAAPALGFVVVVAWLGCYLQGCDFGPPLGAGAPGWLEALGTFPRWADDAALGAGPPVLLHQVATGALPTAERLSLPVHPTQLYEAGVGVMLLALCWWGAGREPFRGARGLGLVGGYALASVLLSPLHADPERGAGTPLLLAVLALASVACAARQWRLVRLASARN